MENLFRSAFGQQDCFTFGVFHHDGHHAPREIERYLIELLILLDQRFPVKIRTIQNRPVEQILEAGLEVADQVTVQQHLVGFAPRYVAVPHEDDTILSERAGLVRAQYVHAPEVLNGVEPLDDHFLAAHGERAIGEADGDDHGQHLGSQAHGHGQSRRKRRPSNRAW